MRQQFYQGSDALLLVFDLTNPETFKKLPDWFLDIKKQLNIPDDEIIGYVIGNKKDLTDKRKINEESAKKIADTFNLKYIETFLRLHDPKFHH